MNEIYEPGTRIISREQCAKNAVFFFVVISLFLHVKYGGLLSLWTLKAVAYFVVGIFAASLTIGVLMYGGNRLLETVLFNRHPNTRGIGSSLFVVILLVMLYKGSATAYFWIHPTQNDVTWVASDHESTEHFQNAKRTSEQLWDIMGKVGQPGIPQPSVTPEQLQSLVTVAIKESSRVEESYLAKIHPKLPEKYKRLFIPSLHGISDFFQSQDEQAITDALQAYGRYADWMNSHYRDFRVIE